MKRAKPLIRVHAIYDHQWSKYPDRIKVPMDDSHVIEYQIVVKLPKPVMRSWLDKFNHICLQGYMFNREEKRDVQSVSCEADRLGEVRETSSDADG